MKNGPGLSRCISYWKWGCEPFQRPRKVIVYQARYRFVGSHRPTPQIHTNCISKFWGSEIWSWTFFVNETHPGKSQNKSHMISARLWFLFFRNWETNGTGKLKTYPTNGTISQHIPPIQNYWNHTVLGNNISHQWEVGNSSCLTAFGWHVLYSFFSFFRRVNLWKKYSNEIIPYLYLQRTHPKHPTDSL